MQLYFRKCVNPVLTRQLRILRLLTGTYINILMTFCGTGFKSFDVQAITCRCGRKEAGQKDISMWLITAGFMNIAGTWQIKVLFYFSLQEGKYDEFSNQ